MVLVMPAFLFVICLGHELKRALGLRGCTVFLDKTCIHQTDKDLQREGILKLGAFLRSSSKMLVVYSDIYLTKLWTVYEVACFLSLHPTSNMTVVPISQPVLILAGMISLYATCVMNWLLQEG